MPSHASVVLMGRACMDIGTDLPFASLPAQVIQAEVAMAQNLDQYVFRVDEIPARIDGVLAHSTGCRHRFVEPSRVSHQACCRL